MLYNLYKLENSKFSYWLMTTKQNKMTEDKLSCENDFQQRWLDINSTVECKKIHLSIQIADFWTNGSNTVSFA